jgi:hypothetical protein
VSAREANYDDCMMQEAKEHNTKLWWEKGLGDGMSGREPFWSHQTYMLGYETGLRWRFEALLVDLDIQLSHLGGSNDC